MGAPMSYKASELAQSPAFLAVVRGLAVTLRTIFRENPRIARLLAAHQRWLLSHAGMALHLEGEAEGLTAARLRELIMPHQIASRNTVQNFLDQLESYRFIQRVGPGGRYRPRRYLCTAMTEQAMFRWYVANLGSIDAIDGGARAAEMMARPALFRLAQPRMARACLNEKDWREPPERVALFLWTEAGGMVMDEFIGRIPNTAIGQEKIDIGQVDARTMADEFMMSRTHLQRMLRKATDQGSLGWNDGSTRGGMWFSGEFLQEYCNWQAIKFALVDEAFAWACEQLKSDGKAQGLGGQ